MREAGQGRVGESERERARREGVGDWGWRRVSHDRGRKGRRWLAACRGLGLESLRAWGGDGLRHGGMEGRGGRHLGVVSFLCVCVCVLVFCFVLFLFWGAVFSPMFWKGQRLFTIVTNNFRIHRVNTCFSSTNQEKSHYLCDLATAAARQAFRQCRLMRTGTGLYLRLRRTCVGPASSSIGSGTRNSE